MNTATVIKSLSLISSFSRVWKATDDIESKKFDAASRKVLELILDPSILGTTRDILINGTEKLPLRLAKAALDPNFRSFLERSVDGKLDDGVREVPVVCSYCRTTFNTSILPDPEKSNTREYVASNLFAIIAVVTSTYTSLNDASVDKLDKTVRILADRLLSGSDADVAREYLVNGQGDLLTRLSASQVLPIVKARLSEALASVFTKTENVYHARQERLCKKCGTFNTVVVEQTSGSIG